MGVSQRKSRLYRRRFGTPDSVLIVETGLLTAEMASQAEVEWRSRWVSNLKLY